MHALHWNCNKIFYSTLNWWQTFLFFYPEQIIHMTSLIYSYEFIIDYVRWIQFLFLLNNDCDWMFYVSLWILFILYFGVSIQHFYTISHKPINFLFIKFRCIFTHAITFWLYLLLPSKMLLKLVARYGLSNCTRNINIVRYKRIHFQ